MGGGNRSAIGVDAAAAAAFAAASGFAIAKLLLEWGFTNGVAEASILTCALIFLLVSAGLERIASDGRMRLAPFSLVPMPAFEASSMAADELLLSEADRLPIQASHPAGSAEVDELVLDDVLAELEPDARVVRLFDVAAMPTPGELRDRIDRHLGSSNKRSAPPDASAALHQALAELRRSLR